MHDVIAPCALARQRLEVLVIGDDERPLRDITVELRNGERAQRDRTDALGRCEFDGLPGDAVLRLSLVELDADAWEVIAAVPLRPELARGRAAAWQPRAAPGDAPATTHIVAAGECLLRIGYERGLLPETIWSYRPNAAVWGKYHSKAIVPPGLTVHIPPRRLCWVDATGGQLVILHRIGIPIEIAIRVLDPAGRPYRGCPYVLRLTRASGEALPHRTGVTDDRGILRAPAEPDVVAGSLIVEPPGGARRWQLALDVGALGPANLPSGARARLTNLGRGLRGRDGRGTSAGFRIAPEGVLDDATATRLVHAHRS